ncbi:ATP-binding protein [Inhella gelatinilytica]|uniref:histidine kinase n=1 Tax=Inhella gelatinilytica TaxID=2795030 RepID=A0A931IZN1_9BURK|nr:ATP-binding protein [Inhella gelatinilytica]MBH9554054.1 HAMP domain-containing protein [Inhella gelatinilytica]
MIKRLVGLNLFWRTFAWLALLLAGAGLGWLTTFRALEAEPRALQAAQQLGDLVLLSQAALGHVEAIERVILIKSLEQGAAVKVRVAELRDEWQSYDHSPFERQIASALIRRLGSETFVARSVNGEAGLWVRFQAGRDAFWLRAAQEPSASLPAPRIWWLMIVAGATLLGSALIAGLINRPLRALSVAAHRIKEGEYDSRLDEHTLTSEIREVNRGFNRMAQVLAKLEQDRSIMMAGISHDLRTPLARLRLELEMSVNDEAAKQAMAQDIDQLDAVIGKFMDYARPGERTDQALALSDAVAREALAFRDAKQIRIHNRVAPDLLVRGDPTELARVLQNLFENARRYGHAPGEAADVHVSALAQGAEVLLQVRDHGPGVPRDSLPELTKPFYRGDRARTAASGSGLGLAIVEKSLARMGAQLEISNADGGGLQTKIRFRRAN